MTTNKPQQDRGPLIEHQSEYFATFRIREMQLVDPVEARTEHGDRVVIPAGTYLRVVEIV